MTKLQQVILTGAVAAMGLTSVASAATQVVAGFGDGGWYSWDTRAAGVQLVGTNNTHPYGPTYFGVPATAADDTAIAKQIIFMGEGQTVNTADGNPPPGASPTGSLSGYGYVRLDGTASNSGKSDISYVNTSGIAPGTALQDPGFTLSYNYYIEPNPTFRTLGLNISLIGSDGKNYTFAHIQDGSAQPTAVTGWNSETVNTSTGIFSLFVSGIGSGGTPRTLADWATEGTYGPFMFNSSAEIYRVGFNIGSSQRQAEQYLDYMSSNLLNGGDVIDFQGPGASVPEPMSLGILGMGAMGLLMRRRRA